MTWRRFTVLLGGLSSRSRLAEAMSREGGPSADVTISDADGIDAFVESLAGG